MKSTLFAMIWLVFSFSVQSFPTTQLNNRKPVKGFADLHNHMLAEYAFGGAWFHGSHAGHEMEAMASCSGNSPFKGHHHAQTSIPVVSEFIGMVPGSHGDTGLHLGKKGGYPDYSGWPRWDTIAHQQVWEGFLKEAHQNGLSLMVVSAVNFKPLCLLMPEKNRKYSCEDMDAVDRQIEALHEFVKERDWVELALSPEHAREIIHSGKLALVLSIEVSDLFEGMDWRKALDHYYSKGVRTLQVVHQLNNRFSGAAIHNNIFKVFETLRSLKGFDLKRLGFQLDSEGKNTMGLTQEGKDLMKAMIKKNMLIDLAHISEKGVQDLKKLLKDTSSNYPLYISHGHFKDVMVGKFADYEKSSPQWILDLIKEHNGVFGLRTGPEATKSFGKVPNDCDGSTKSFAQAYEFGLSQGVVMGFGSDLNGFIQQLRPRFGNSAESCGAKGESKRRQVQQKLQSGQLGKSFDQTGFGHVGQLGDIVAELKNFGVDTSVIENSSEFFLQMWQRAYPVHPTTTQPFIDRLPAGEEEGAP